VRGLLYGQRTYFQPERFADMPLLPGDNLERLDNVSSKVRAQLEYVGDELSLPRRPWLASRFSRAVPLGLSPEEMRSMGLRRVRLKDDAECPAIGRDRVERPIYIWPVLSRREYDACVAEMSPWAGFYGGWDGARSLAIAASRRPAQVEGLVTASRRTEIHYDPRCREIVSCYRLTVFGIDVVPPARKKLVGAAMTVCVQEQILRDLRYLDENRTEGLPPLRGIVAGEAESRGGLRILNDLARTMENFSSSNRGGRPIRAKTYVNLDFSNLSSASGSRI